MKPCGRSVLVAGVGYKRTDRDTGAERAGEK
jgi:hypothetical protein